MKTFRLMSTLFFLFVLCLGIHAQQRLLGGDISLLPSYEEAGTVYRDEAGKAVAPLEYFKEEGWNAIRVRLFVEPDRASAEHKGEGVCQDLDYVMKLGQRNKKKPGISLCLTSTILIRGRPWQAVHAVSLEK